MSYISKKCVFSLTRHILEDKGNSCRKEEKTKTREKEKMETMKE